MIADLKATLLAGPILMPIVAITEFALAKALSLQGAAAPSRRRLAGYLLLWPGMDARAFFKTERAERPRPWALGAGLLQWALGLALVRYAAVRGPALPLFWCGWLGMLGVIFSLHFGLFAIAAWLWQRAGVAAKPIMHTPLMARSVGELWGARWNLAFADLARRYVFKPLARTTGAAVAGVAVFVVSGLVHESVISLPARAGWGRPTAYFLIQAAGLLIKKSRLGTAIGLGRGVLGRTWTVIVALLPLPLAFPPAFAERVIAPVVLHLHALLP